MELLIGVVVCYFIYKMACNIHKNKSVHHKIVKNQRAIEPHQINSVCSFSTSSHKFSPLEDDEFAIFYSHNYFDEEVSSNKTLGRWIGEGEQLLINGRQFSRGLFYFGGKMDSLDGYGIEPSLIDENRSASKTNLKDACFNSMAEDAFAYYDYTIDYWSKYATISEKCRGVFLDWLASERSNPYIQIGYVLIYFYGLERRVIENINTFLVADEEFLIIFNEVYRLNNIYKNNYSFHNYSSNFLELMYLLRSHITEISADKIPTTRSSLIFKVKLATKVANGESIDSQLAFEWLKNTHEYSLKMPARRCEKEFRILFSLKFKEKFGDNFIVKPNKTKLIINYQPASNGIKTIDISIGDLPDPSNLQGPINRLKPLAEQCSSELEKYSRYLGRTHSKKEDMTALLLLPEALMHLSSSSINSSFKNWTRKIVLDHGGLTTVREFWLKAGMSLPKAINKKENDLMINLAKRAGVSLAPDYRFHQNAKLNSDCKIVLFQSIEDDFVQSESIFNQLSLAIKLGAMVATIDGEIGHNEKNILVNLIETNKQLTAFEKQSLNAYLIWQLVTPANITGLKKRIQLLNFGQIEYLKQFLLSIALADGRIENSQIRQLEKLYISIGLDKSTLHSDIHNFRSTIKIEPLNTFEILSNHLDNAFILNETILDMHESETLQAKTMLESIFVEEDVAKSHSEIKLKTNKLSELDKSHKSLFNALITKENWSREEITTLCQQENLMVEAAIEIINDWSYEVVNAPVLEDDGSIFVDMEILEELRG